jgi:hypothetical protein
MWRAVLCAGSILLASCQQQDHQQVDSKASTDALEPVSIPVPQLSDRDLIRVCRGAASFRNGTAVNRIKARKSSANLVRLSYTRTDGKSFAYDCMIEGKEVRFRMIDEAGTGRGPGTWSGRGSKTTFEIRPDEIDFTDDFFDGSTDKETIKI